MLRPAYLSKKLTRPLPTKDGGILTGPHALGAGQGCAPRSGSATERSRCCYPNLVWPAPPLRSEMIFGKHTSVASCRRAARSDRSGMLPQFIDEDPRVLAVVYGDRDQLHAALLKSLLERRHQPLGGLDPRPSRVVSARERDEIRVSQRHAEIGKTVGRLLPADHAVGVVLQDQHPTA